MKNYLLYINMLLFTFLWGCSQEEVTFTLGQNGDDVVLTLTLDNSEQISRSADSGAEDNINKVDLFLYTSGSSESAICYRENLTTTTTAKGEGITSTTGTDGNVTTTVTVVISSTEASNLGLNAANGTCDAYVIVNNNEAYKKADNGKISDTTKGGLKGTTITTNFEDEQTGFVMDGEGTISKSGNGFAGNIPLTRTASKITLTITKITDVTEDGVQWEAKTDAMRVFLYNGVKKASINGDCTLESSNYFTSQKGTSFSGTDVPFTQSSPFYSYPSNWGSGDNKDEEAYLVLLLPWTIKDTDIPVNFYYKVPIGSTQSLIRNTHYQISLEVGILGVKDLEDIEDVTLSPTCILLNWNNEEEIVGNLDKAKYLVVDKKTVYIHNKKQAYVNYKSSDEVSVVITKITRPDYSSESVIKNNFKEGTEVFYSGDGETTVNSSEEGLLKECTVYVDKTDVTSGHAGQIVLEHELVSQNLTGNYDYLPYTITVMVTNQSGFKEEITYIQYPDIYVEADYNDGGDMANIGGDGNEDKGYVIVNTLYADRKDYSTGEWQTVEGFDNTSYNPNMYIITTTALSPDFADTYILGDSRNADDFTASKVGFTSVTDVNERTLQKYHPTKTDRNDYLSPKFRIASAYGQLGHNILTHQQAKNRCAAYQENGYPAGRWRLATTAELEYIARLCSKGAIPSSLFGGSGYWSATQICTLDTEEGTISTKNPDNSSTAWLRCVYDDWYWGGKSLKDKTQYTWGDESTTDELNAMDSQQ